MSLEIVLLMPVLMLLALFVLWAGRAGRAVLMVDLVAEEAATAAALGCEKGLDDACEDLVDGIVSARPGLGFLCVGGVRPGPDRERMVDQRWVSLAVGEQPPPGEISAAGLFGVSFQCETDGAVAPLRGLFPTVTFLGQASEVAMQLGPPKVSISDVEVWEGEPLKFVLSLSTPPVTDVTLDYSVRAATPHTYGGMCETGGSSDVAPPAGSDVAPPAGSDVDLLFVGSDVDPLFVGSDVDPLFVGSVTIIRGQDEATIEVPTCEDDIYEADEKVELKLTLGEAPPEGEAPPVTIVDPVAEGVVLNDDSLNLTVTAERPGWVSEGSDTQLEFVVELGPVGRDLLVEFDTPAMDSDWYARPSDADVIVCPSPNTGDPVDYLALSGDDTSHTFEPSLDTAKHRIVVQVCDDQFGERYETVRLDWSASVEPEIVGSAEAVIRDDEPWLEILDGCVGTAQEGIEEADACVLEEDDAQVTFRVRRTATSATSPAVTVHYVTLPNDPGAGVAHDAAAGGVGVGDVVLDPCSAPPDQPLDVRPMDSSYDYVPTSGTLEFSQGGPGEEEMVVTVEIANDQLDEHNEFFRLRLCRPTDGAAYLWQPWGRAVIVDDDETPTVTVGDASMTEPANLNTATDLEFTVALSEVSGRDVTIRYYTDHVGNYPPGDAPQSVLGLTATPREDYTAIPADPVRSIVFPAESATLAYPIRVLVLHDDLDEGDETLALRLDASNAEFVDKSGSCAPDQISNDCALGAIIDNDALPAVAISGPTDAVTEGGSAEFTLRLVDQDDPDTMTPSSREVTVGYRVVHAGTPAALPHLTADGNDLEPPLSGTWTIPAGSTQVDVEVKTSDDSVDEGDDDDEDDFELFEVQLTPADTRNATLVDSVANAGARIADNDGRFHVALMDRCTDAQDLPDAAACGREHDGRGVRFTVALVDGDGNRTDSDGNPHVSGLDVTVGYKTVQEPPGPGAATEGTDYSAPPDGSRLTIKAGASNASFTVEVLDDDFHEEHETFEVQLEDAVNADLGNASGKGAIVDNEPEPMVFVDDAVAVEGSEAVFVLRLIHPEDDTLPAASQRPAYSGRQISVGYNTFGNPDSPHLGATPGLDYTSTPSGGPKPKATFAPHSDQTSVRVETLPDGIAEPPESFQLRLALDDDHAVLHRPVATGTITEDTTCVDLTDDDRPDELATLIVDSPSVDEGAGSLDFTISSTLRFCHDVEVSYSSGGVGEHPAAAGVDFAAGSGTLVLPAQSNSVAGEIEILDDSLDEHDEQFAVTVNWDASSDLMATYRTVAAVVGTVTISDNDATPVVAVSGSEDAWEGTTAQYVVRLVDPGAQDGKAIASGREVTVNYYTCCLDATPDSDTTPDADYSGVPEATPATLVFPADDPSTLRLDVSQQTISIAIHDDALSDSGERFQLVLDEPEHAVLGASATITTTILDGEPPLVWVSSPTAAESGILVFHVAVVGEFDEDVTVRYVTEDLPPGPGHAVEGLDYRPRGELLVFRPSGARVQYREVRVQSLGDQASEGAEVFRLRLISADRAALHNGDSTFGTGTINEWPQCIDPAVRWHPQPRVFARNSERYIRDVRAAAFPLFNSAVRNGTQEYEHTLRWREDQMSSVGTSGISIRYIWDELCDGVSAVLTMRIVHDTSDPSDLDGDGSASITIGGIGFTGINQSIVVVRDDDTVEEEEVFRIQARWDYRNCWYHGWSCGRQRIENVYSAVVNADGSLTVTGTPSYTSPLTSLFGDWQVMAETEVVIIDNDCLASLESLAPLGIGLAVPARVSEGANEGAGSYDLSIRVHDPLCEPAQIEWYFPASVATDSAGVSDVRLGGAVGSGQMARGQQVYTATIGASDAGAIIQDNIHEDEEEFTVRFKWGTGTPEDWQKSGPYEATVIIEDDDPPPRLVVEDTTADVNSTMSFTVKLENSMGMPAPSGLPVSVRYRTEAMGDTVEARSSCSEPGADYIGYIGESNELVFAPGDVVKEVPVTICGDSRTEPDERLQLVLLTSPRPVGAEIQDSVGIGVIDGLPMVSVSDADPDVSEDDGSVELLVMMSERLADDVTLSWATEECALDVVLCPRPATDGADYVGASGSVTIPAGDVSAPISVELLDDGVDEFAEYFWVRLSDPPAGVGLLPGETHPGPVGIGQIAEDDADRPVLDFETDSLELAEGNTFTFDVVHNSDSVRTITVDWVAESPAGSRFAEDGVDYATSSGSLSFAAGQDSASFTVASLSDTFCESDERFRVRLSNPRHADLAADAVAWATITDVDCTPQDASIGDSIFAESAGTVTFTVSLTEPWPADDVTLSWATEECAPAAVLCPHPATEGEDYVGASGPVTIPAGAVSAPISVELLDDGVDEFAEYFWVRLSDPPDGFTVLPGETHPGPVGIGQISEDDADLPVLEFETDSLELVEGGTFAFEVAVIGESARTIAVDWDTVTSSGLAYAIGDVDYRGDSGRLSIRAGRRSARFTVASIADTQCEPDERFGVRLSNPSRAGLPADAEEWVTITDDDCAPVEVRLSSTSPPAISAAGTFEVRVDFTLPVTGFTSDDIVIVNGELVSLSGSSSTYTATVRPSAPGTVVVRVPRDVAQDSYGYGNAQSLPLTRTAWTGNPESRPGIDTWDRDAVLEGYRTEFLRTEPDSGYTGDVVNCEVGTTSQTYRDSVVQRTNWYRNMAGVVDVAERADLSVSAQRKLTILLGQGRFVHEPLDYYWCFEDLDYQSDMSDLRLNPVGENLAKGGAGVEAVDAYIRDHGTRNLAVGHRHLVLDPHGTHVGTGDGFRAQSRWNSTIKANVMHFVDDAVDPKVREVRDFVAWPAPGFALPATTSGRWSFSLGEPDVGLNLGMGPILRRSFFSRATVTMSDDNGPVAAEIIHRGHVLTWAVAGDTNSTPISAPSDGDHCYTVRITGVQINRATQEPYEYAVCILDAPGVGAGEPRFECHFYTVGVCTPHPDQSEDPFG